MDTNRSWSIDDKRLNFQFGCEIAWEVKDGQLGQMLRNPTYTGIGPRFWASMDMVGGPDEWVFWGTANCGKGQPIQVGHTGHPSVPGPLLERPGGGALMAWDPAADDVAQRGFDTCDRVLALVGDRAEALVTCGQGTNALTRFANSRIHQNMASDDDHVRLRIVVDGGRIAQASTTRVDPDGLERLVESTIAAARLCPADPEYPGLADPAGCGPTSITTTPTPRRRHPTRAPRSWPTSSEPAPTSSRPGTAPPTPTPTCCAPPPGSATRAGRPWPRWTPSTGRRPSTGRPPMATARRPRSASPTSTVAGSARSPRPRPSVAPTRSSSTPAPTRWCSSPRPWRRCCSSQPGSASTGRPTRRARASPTSTSSSSTTRSTCGTTAPTRAPSAAPTTRRARRSVASISSELGSPWDWPTTGAARRSRAPSPPAAPSARSPSAATRATCSSPAATSRSTSSSPAWSGGCSSPTSGTTASSTRRRRSSRASPATACSSSRAAR